MRPLVFVITLVMSSSLFAQETTYQLVIDQDTLEIVGNKVISYKKDSCSFDIQLLEQEYKVYRDSFVSFEYASKYSLSKSEVGEGIEQVLLMTNGGNGFIIQEYSGIDPSAIIDVMLTQVTRKSVSSGYEQQTEEVEVPLKNGLVLTGLKSTLTYQKALEEYMVVGNGTEEKGILLITISNDNQGKESTELFKRLFSTIQIAE